MPLSDGMILSIEPGYYREGAFGIRLENLAVVRPAGDMLGGDAHRAMLAWETLSFAPMDTRLIVPDLLSMDARDWLNAYHRDVAEKIGPQLSPVAKLWLDAATAPV